MGEEKREPKEGGKSNKTSKMLHASTDYLVFFPLVHPISSFT
jgi:hypothetical protein